MEKSKKALEALRNDLHHVPMTDRLASAFRHLDAALSALEGSQPKEPPRYVRSGLTVDKVMEVAEETGAIPDNPDAHWMWIEKFRTRLEAVAGEQPKEQGAEPVDEERELADHYLYMGWLMARGDGPMTEDDVRDAFLHALKYARAHPSPTSREKAMEAITRFEVIDDTGRAYAKRFPAGSVTESIQDDGLTLKVFIAAAAKSTK